MKERQTSHAPGSLLVISTGEVVDFRHLALVVPIRLQNETICIGDSCPLSKKCDSKMNLYAQTTLRRLVKNSF